MPFRLITIPVGDLKSLRLLSSGTKKDFTRFPDLYYFFRDQKYPTILVTAPRLQNKFIHFLYIIRIPRTR